MTASIWPLSVDGPPTIATVEASATGSETDSAGRDAAKSAQEAEVTGEAGDVVGLLSIST
ncbi:hypothetical protein AB0M80_42375 [Amycolatopsis sp. NPDC051045]|uniref:hypothetical protein n=1 Tax=Amycolatopsis sp. NPDC051045 TaxID=3156922 RepID=UPI003442F92C